MKKTDIIIFLVMISSILLGMAGMAMAGVNHTIYRAGIDNHGFYRVFNATSNKLAPYENYTLNIKIGDTVVWVNDVDSRRTIVSDQKLWDNNNGTLKWAYKQFVYIFNKSGIYTFYIKENNKQKQKIIVGQVISSTIKKNHTVIIPTPTPIITPVPIKIPAKTSIKTIKTPIKTPKLSKPKIDTSVPNVTQDTISSLFSQLIPRNNIRNNKDIRNIRNSNISVNKTPGFDIIIAILSIMLIISIRYFRKKRKN